MIAGEAPWRRHGHQGFTPGGNNRKPTGGSSRSRNASCSFCRKSYRDVGPLVEGPADVFICGECVELCQSIIEQEKRRRTTGKPVTGNTPTPAPSRKSSTNM